MPTMIRKTQAQAVAELSAPLMDWDGSEDEAYEDYAEKMPTKAELKTFETPELYWEVLSPGCTIFPYPRSGGFASRPSGVWECHNIAQRNAVRHYIQTVVRVDPDTLKVTEDDLKALNGQGEYAKRLRYCQNGGCFFVCPNQDAVTLHETLRQHDTKSTPRKDYQ